MKKILYIYIVLMAMGLSLKIVAQPLPAAYIKTSVMSGLQFPTDFDWTSDGRYFITQKGGNASGFCADAKILVYDGAGTFLNTFYDLTDSVNCDFERGLLGIAVDPGFDTNHYVYAYYVHTYSEANDLRILRFTEASNAGTEPTIIMDIDLNMLSFTPPGNHVGGILRFRPSEPSKIYVQIGDLAHGSGESNLADDLNYPFGKILRINKDGSIPTDNPFYDDGNVLTGNDDRIWSYGHRNMFGMCFNPVTDSMYSSENGLNTWDEYNIIHKGGNYGWYTCEGNFMNSSITTPCELTGDVRPIATWGSPLPSVTGTLFYTSSEMPEFDNHILVADNNNGKIYDLTMGNPPNYDTVISKTTFADITDGGLTAMRQGPTDGCIYVMKGGYTTNGGIYRICDTASTTTGITINDHAENVIGQNYPNPAMGSTQIDYTIAHASDVTIELMDVTGRKIETVLTANNVQAGKHTVAINNLDKFATGTYFYKIEVKENNKMIYSETKRIVVTK